MNLPRDPFADDARRLLHCALEMGTTSPRRLLDIFPALYPIFERPGFNLPEHWDFFHVSAGLGTGLIWYGLEHDEQSVEPFVTAAFRQMSHWDADAVTAVGEFQAFVSHTVSTKVDLPTAIGTWVLRESKGSEPSMFQLQAAPAIGMPLLLGIRDWSFSRAGSLTPLEPVSLAA